MSSLPTIACKNCDHVNEGQRIYCHNCGNKLDRAEVLGKEKKNEDTAAQQQKRVKKMMNPGSGLLGWGTVKTALRTFGWAAFAAFIINVVRPPASVPPMPKDALGSAPTVDLSLESLTMASPGMRATFSEEDLNLYLLSTVRSKKGESIAVFQRAFVNLDEGIFQITSQTAVQNYPLYAGVSYKAKIENDTLEAIPAGLHLGRMDLQIPEAALKPAERVIALLFAPLWTSLKREAKLVGELGAMELKKGQVILYSKGSKITPASP